MALNHMTIGEMVTSTEAWAKPGAPEHTALMRVPTLAALMPSIQAAVRGLLELQRVSVDQLAAQLVELRRTMDFRHDSLARLVFYLLEVCIQDARAATDGKAESEAVKLRNFLMPHGLEMTGFSYSEEAGQAHLLASRITPEVERQLAEIPLKNNRSLLDMVRQLIAAGEELGRLEAEFVETKLPNQQASFAEVRNNWMRMVQAVRTVARLEPDLDPVLVRALERVHLMSTRRSGRNDEATGELPGDELPGDELPGDELPGDELPGDGNDAVR